MSRCQNALCDLKGANDDPQLSEYCHTVHFASIPTVQSMGRIQVSGPESTANPVVRPAYTQGLSKSYLTELLQDDLPMSAHKKVDPSCAYSNVSPNSVSQAASIQIRGLTKDFCDNQKLSVYMRE